MLVLDIPKKNNMVFYATFNNISAIKWQSVLLVVETREEPLTCRKCLTNFFLHNVVSSTPSHERDSAHNFSGDRY